MPKESMEKIKPKERPLTGKEKKEWYEEQERAFLWTKKVLDKENRRIQQAKDEGDEQSIRIGKEEKYHMLSEGLLLDYNIRPLISGFRVEKEGSERKQRFKNLLTELAETFVEGVKKDRIGIFWDSENEVLNLSEMLQALHKDEGGDKFKEGLRLVAELMRGSAYTIEPLRLAGDKEGLKDLVRQLKQPEDVKEARDAIKEIEGQEKAKKK